MLYLPDFMVNAGGVIQVADERHGFDFERARERTARIFQTTLAVLAEADAEQVPPSVAADALAERRMADRGHAGSDLARLTRRQRRGGGQPPGEATNVAASM